jgi:chromosome segregation ATPase
MISPKPTSNTQTAIATFVVTFAEAIKTIKELLLNPPKVAQEELAAKQQQINSLTAQISTSEALDDQTAKEVEELTSQLKDLMAEVAAATPATPVFDSQTTETEVTPPPALVTEEETQVE